MGQKISQRAAHTSQVASTDTFVMNVGGTTKRVAPEYVLQALGLSNAYAALTDAATTVWAYSKTAKLKTWIIGGNRTLSLTGTADGDGGVLFLIQDGTGGRVPVLPGNFPSGKNFSSGASQVDLLTWTNRGGVIWWDIINYGTVSSGGGNTTPAAPTLTADDTANTLSASHALGTSEIVVSENGGAYVAYSGQINVGDVARAAGYWKFKIKAATGRNESAVVNSPEFTVAGGGSAGSWTQLTAATSSGGTIQQTGSTLPNGGTWSHKFGGASDGAYFEFTRRASSGSDLGVISIGANDANYNWGTVSSADHNIYIAGGGALTKYSGSYNLTLSQTAAGDVVRITKSGANLLVSLNGSNVGQMDGVFTDEPDGIIKFLAAGGTNIGFDNCTHSGLVAL